MPRNPVVWARFQASRWGSGIEAVVKQGQYCPGKLRYYTVKMLHHEGGANGWTQVLSTWKRHTLNTLDLARAKPGHGSLVLGTRDARGADGSLDIDKGSTRRGPPLPKRHAELLGRHGRGIFL